jgi:glycosyltransferase involved in cell wall biosynthesis
VTNTALPLVSVLTPVYNGAAYIEECMKSILQQTYPNWSYTIVDNCSTDETPEIVERIAHTDSRIRYVRFEEFVEANENHSRAAAAMEPESVYCKFVQGDDWIYPECLERMVERAESADSIGIVGSYRLHQDTVELVGLPYSRTVVPGTEVLRQCLLGGPYVTGSPTATLLRSDLVRRRTPFYDTSYWHADTEAAYRFLAQSDFGYVHQVLTFSREQQGTRSSQAGRVNTYDPENIRFLLRYGPIALSEAEYRAKLRLELRRYLYWHARQALKPSRASDREFFDFHWTATERIMREGGEDPRIRRTMQLVRALLHRDRVLNRVRPGHAGSLPSAKDSES